MINRYVLTIFVAFLFSKLVVSLPSKGNKLIYILVDGFRYDYVDDHTADDIPGFSKILQNGVRAEYMSPAFPSVSYPDWTTLVTGLWVESHGVVGNEFYDAENRDEFLLNYDDTTGKKKWWTAEPIWTTATKANKRTAVFSWSRCDIPFDGVVPDFCEEFTMNPRRYELFRENVEKAVMKLEQGFDFIQIYTDYTDAAGHRYGPESEERKQAVREVDAIINYMLERIEEIGMTDQVNIIIVSDHGMTTTAPGDVNRVEIDDYLLTEYIENIAGGGAFMNIKVKDGFVDQVYERLRDMPAVGVYLHDEIPEHLHYKNHKYIHDIVLVADIKTLIMQSWAATQIPPRTDSYVLQGTHGYDPREEKMRTIFFATGPDFKNGSSHRIPPIQNVDVYPLLAHLLQVKPLPNNGTLATIKMALKSGDAISASNIVAMNNNIFVFVISLSFLYVRPCM